MKTWIVWVLCLLLMFSGCGSPGELETLGNISCMDPDPPQPRQISLQLPQDVAKSAMSGEQNALYYGQGYSILVQTFASGDLAATARSVSGYDLTALTVMKSRCADHERYEWVWTATGEEGDVVCRAAVLDDGVYHYTLQVIVSAQEAGELSQKIQSMFQSFCLQ